MDKQEERKEEGLSLPKDTQINLVVNNSDMEEDTIDLGRVFRNFKEKRRVFAWLLLFCLLAGISASLLMYQINKKPLTVASVVTLRYMVDTEETDEETRKPIRRQVTDLTAPDGKTQLDLSQVSSAYVLQNALNNIELSREISIPALSGNITIQRIPAEESRRQQELVNSMMSNTSTVGTAYEKAESLVLRYSNQFIASLTNGFGDEDSGKVYLEDAELQALLNQILDSYNDYLVETYGTLKTPSDEISIIDTAALDPIESLDMLRSGLDNLVTYCNEQEESVKAYRSWQSGLTMKELVRKIGLIQEVSVEYLYSHIITDSIVKDPESVLNKYQYELRDAQFELDEVKENITSVQNILDNYKNDDIYVSTQESDSTRSTQRASDYYNTLVLTQADNYDKAAELKVKISDLEEKIANVKAVGKEGNSSDVSAELERVMTSANNLYQEVFNHIMEIQESPFYQTFAEASAAQGKSENFLTASMKNMVMFGAVGAVIALALWFFSALAPEFRHHEDEKKEKADREEKGKGAAEV